MAKKKLDEAACLALIAQGDGDALDIIRERLPSAEARFNKLDKALCDYLAFVKRAFPDAEYYTASGGFNLMLGAPHSRKLVPQQELVAFTGNAAIGDGDF